MRNAIGTARRTDARDWRRRFLGCLRSVERLRCAGRRPKIAGVIGLLLWIAFGVLLSVAVSRHWRRLRVAGRLNALTAADPPAEEFERERARIASYRRGLALAAALIGAIAGAALDALIGIVRLLGRG